VISRSLYLSTPHGFDRGLPWFAFELVLEVPKYVGTPVPGPDAAPELARHRFTEVLSALRLFKNGGHSLQHNPASCGAPSSSAAQWSVGN
jgi:hypothetical protein